MDMRISVCEFLRIKTGMNWFYVAPGKWMSDRGTHVALRVGKTYRLMERWAGTDNFTAIDDLTYFRGESSVAVRSRTQNKNWSKKIKDLS